MVIVITSLPYLYIPGNFPGHFHIHFIHSLKPPSMIIVTIGIIRWRGSQDSGWWLCFQWPSLGDHLPPSDSRSYPGSLVTAASWCLPVQEAGRAHPAHPAATWRSKLGGRSQPGAERRDASGMGSQKISQGRDPTTEVWPLLGWLEPS